MSLDAWKWACSVEVGSHTARAVLYHLANYANTERRAWPSQSRIATELELSIRTVGGALALLEKLGLISRQRRNRERGWGRTSDMIRLNMPGGAGEWMEAGEGDATEPSNRQEMRVANPGNRQEMQIGEAAHTGSKQRQATGSSCVPRTSKDKSQDTPFPPAGVGSPSLAWAPPQVRHPVEPIQVPAAPDRAEPVELVERNGVFEPVEVAKPAGGGPEASGAGLQVEAAPLPALVSSGKKQRRSESKHGRGVGAGPCLLPDDWAPEPRHFAKAAGEGFTAAFVEGVADAMRSWCRSNAHRAVARKSDWNATFDGFLRRDMAEAARRRPKDKPRFRNAYFEAAADLIERRQAEARQGSPRDELLGGVSPGVVGLLGAPFDFGGGS